MGHRPVIGPTVPVMIKRWSRHAALPADLR